MHRKNLPESPQGDIYIYSSLLRGEARTGVIYKPIFKQKKNEMSFFVLFIKKIKFGKNSTCSYIQVLQ
jgi:hypothetical protein